MSSTPKERPFEESGKSFTAVLNEQPDHLLSVSVRLPDDSLRVVPGEHFESEERAMQAAHAFANELVGSC